MRELAIRGRRNLRESKPPQVPPCGYSANGKRTLGRMMSWKQIIVGNAADVARLQNAFIECFIAAGCPTDAVMCMNKKPIRNGYHLFFSPAAASLASHILAQYSS